MQTVTLRNAAGQTTKISHIAIGCMGFSWRDKPVPDEQAFAAMKAAVDSSPDAPVVFNSAIFYGPKSEPTHNVSLIGRFFKTYPDLAPRVFLAVKGGMDPATMKPDSSLDFLRKNVGVIQEKLGSAKKLDCFVQGRLDQSRPIEESVQNLQKLAEEGHFTHIAISEASASSVRRAAKAAPLALLEFEYSPLSLEIETSGIFQACKDNGVGILAYSPTSRGLLTGAIKSIDDIPEGDVRRHYNRFQPEHFDKNLELYKHFESIAQRKKCTTAQLSIAWVIAQGPGICVPLTGSSRVEGVKENLESVNVKLDKQDLDDMRKAIDAATPSGDRKGMRGAELMAADTPEQK